MFDDGREVSWPVQLYTSQTSDKKNALFEIFVQRSHNICNISAFDELVVYTVSKLTFPLLLFF